MGTLVGLTSRTLVVILVGIALVAPCALVWLLLRRRGSTGPTRPGRRRLGAAAGALALVLLAQVAAIGSVFVVVNDDYDFYSDWRDLVGAPSDQPAAIHVSTTRTPGDGHVRVLAVDGRASRTRADVVVWLPHQYDEPAYRHHRFPVVMFLPGQPEQPIGVFNEFRLASAAEDEIAAHHAPPFVLVMPPLMIRPPYDTECTDVPHGPQALSWLSTDVPRAIGHDLRVQPEGRHWSVLGWSTGGFCAAKLLYSRPRAFDAAVGFGAYYQPDLHAVYPDLFGHERRVALANSPEWLYRHRQGTLGRHLLMISSTRDSESWASTRQMLAATAGDPGVGHVTLHEGGHNFRVYQPYVVPSLAWLERRGALA